MKLDLHKLVRVALLLVFLLSTLSLVARFFSGMDSDEAYEDARNIAWGEKDIHDGPEVTPAPSPTVDPRGDGTYYVAAPIENAEDDEYLEELEEINISKLQKTNPDVIGWIFIPGTQIDYPILQGEDNDYYLNHGWKKNRSYSGSIFMECENSSDFTDFNTIIYGHNMGDGSMFADVSRYFSKWYFQEHPYVYIVLPDFVLRYEVFSSYKTTVGSKVYGLSFNQDVTRTGLIEYAVEKSTVDTGIVPDVNDQILTLSTCTGGQKNRWVLHARLKMVPYEG